MLQGELQCKSVTQIKLYTLGYFDEIGDKSLQEEQIELDNISDF